MGILILGFHVRIFILVCFVENVLIEKLRRCFDFFFWVGGGGAQGQVLYTSALRVLS